MKDERKTKKELIAELKKLRSKISRLEGSPTKNKVSEKNLDISEETFRLVFNSCPAGIAYYDKNGVIVDCNNQLAKMLGSTKRKIIGFNARKDIKDKDQKAAVRKALSGEIGIYEGKYKSVTGTKTIYMKTIYGPLLDYKGKLNGCVSITEDVTERKRIEDALVESKSQLEAILQTANEGFWMIDNKGNTVDVNRTLCTILKAPKSKVIGRNVTDFLDEENKKLFRKQMKAGAEGKPVSHEGIFTRLDGSKVHCHVNCSPLFDESGKKIGSFAMISDISERKKTETELQESEERYRTSIEHANDGFIYVEDGKIIFSNRKFLDILGYDNFKDVRNKQFTMFLDPEDRTTVIDIYKRRLKGEPAPSRYECKGIKKNGQQINVEISSAVSTFKENPVIIAFVHDITERKRSVDALREGEAKLKNLFDSATDAIFILDMEGNFVDINRTAHERLGYTREEMLAMNISDINHPDFAPKVPERLDQIRNHGSAKFESAHMRKDGTVMPVEVNSRIIDYDGSKVFFSFIRDITERKLAEDDLKIAYKNLEDEKARTEAIIAAMGDGISIQDTDFKILYQNDVHKGLIGSHIGKYCYNAYESRDRVCDGCPVADSFKDGRIHTSVRTLEKEDGTYYYEITASPLRNLSGQIVAGIEVVRDVTDRKRLEEDFRKSEERFRGAFETASHGMALVAPDGRWLKVNKALCNIVGYSEDELLKADFQTITHPDDLKGDLDLVNKLIAGEIQSYQMEKRYFHKKGTIVWILLSVSLVRDINGDPVHFVSQIQDISARRQAQEALLESEKRFRDLFEDSPVSLWLEDLSDLKARIDELKAKGVQDFEEYFDENPKEVIKCASLIKVIDINKATLELYNAKDKEELITNLEKTFRKESFESIKTGLIAISEGRSDINVETETQTLNGNKIFNSIKWSAVPGYEDTLSRVLVSIIDITEQKLTEEMLRQREQMYRMLIESTSALSWEFDLAAMKFTYVSPQAESITGYPPGEWTDFDFWVNMIIPEDSDWASNYCITETHKGKDHEFEYRIKTADGRIIWLRDIVTVIKEDGKPVKRRGFMFDVSERKNMEEEIRKGKNLESLGILAGGIAHDFNNLLTSILGNVSLAKTFARPEDKISERLTIAENASLRAKDLTRQLLTFSRGGAPVKKVAFISDVIKDSSSFALSGSNVKCEYSLPGDLWPVEIDEGQIGQVIHNLVINARDAMPKGGTITISGSNSIVTDDNNLSLGEGDFVQISVADKGVGISEENISKVFDPYFTTKEMGVQKGMGLGLAICHSIIKSHDGSIVVESEVEKGTTFHFYLPSTERDWLREITEESIELKDVSGSGRILVMDDEAILRDIVSIMLEEIGYEVEVAVDGHNAMDMYKNAINEDRAFDAIILDLTVPGAMGGKDTVKELIAIDPDVKAIVSSGYGNDPVIANYKDHAFKGYIMKPFKIEELGKLLKDMLKK
jgi:PAS domain S-box-containing protein